MAGKANMRFVDLSNDRNPLRLSRSCLETGAGEISRRNYFGPIYDDGKSHKDPIAFDQSVARAWLRPSISMAIQTGTAYSSRVFYILKPVSSCRHPRAPVVQSKSLKHE